MPEITSFHSKFTSSVPAGRKNGHKTQQINDENGPEDIDFSKKIRELRLELEIRKREEERIEKDIAIILEESTIDGGEQNRSFGLSVTRLNNHMLVVENSTKQLTNTLKNISSLADTISGRVSALDVAKTRVVGCLQMASDMRDLGVSAEGIDDAIRSEDFELASQHIHRFLTLDQAVFQIRDFKEKDATDSIRHSYEVLSSAKERLSKILKTRLEDAVKRSDIGEMQRYVKLFPLLNEPDEGLQRFGVHLNVEIDKLAEDTLKIMKVGGTDDNRRNVLYADTLFMFFEGIAGIIESNLPVLENAYGVDKLLDFMFILQARIDDFFRRLLEEFVKNRKLTKMIKTVNQNLYKTQNEGVELLDPNEIDAIVSEICMMNTSVEMYWRFVGRRIGKNPKEPEVRRESEEDVEEEDEKTKEDRIRIKKEEKQKKLDQLLNRSLVGMKMQELIGDYILMEHYYMKKSVQKAIGMDVKDDEKELTSSIVEDTVFIVRKCIRRAAGSGNVDSVCATMNNAIEVLDSGVCEYLGKSIQNGYAASNFAAEALQTAYSAYGKTGKDASEVQKEQFLLALNNSSKMAELLKDLQKGLVMEWAGVKRPAVEKDKLEHSTQQIEEVARKLAQLAKNGVEEMFRSVFKAKIRSCYDAYRDISHQLTMDDLEHFEAHDPFIEGLLATIDRLLVETEPLLYADNYQQILMMVGSELARQFELVIGKCQFNRYGALQLDREYRQICAYLTNVAGWNSREKVARLGQIIGLMNVESVEEAMEVWHNSKSVSIGATRILGLTEVKKVLALRVDFPSSAIKALE